MSKKQIAYFPSTTLVSQLLKQNTSMHCQSKKRYKVLTLQ